MGAFTRTILVRGVRTSELDLIAEICERVPNVMTSAEFTTAIHACIFVGTGRGIISEPTIEPIDRGSLGSKCATENASTVVVGDEDVTGFTVEAHEVVETFRIVALLNHKREIDRKTLKADRGNHGGGGTAGGFAEFRGKANSTIVGEAGHG
jgi:hypothetical protein